MPRDEEPVVIYRAANSQQANLLRNLLEERGIAAWVQNDMIQAAAGDLPLGWRGDSQVVVRGRDAAEARNLALEFEDQLRVTSSPREVDDSPFYAATDTWDDWPTCPGCGQRRHTRCPLCGQAGDGFPLVDLEKSERGDIVLLMCSACDEPFRPQFYRLCHQCGHNFGQGISVAQATDSAGRETTDSNQRKVLAVVGAMILLGLGLAAYFAMLFSR